MDESYRHWLSRLDLHSHPFISDLLFKVYQAERRTAEDGQVFRFDVSIQPIRTPVVNDDLRKVSEFLNSDEFSIEKLVS